MTLRLPRWSLRALLHSIRAVHDLMYHNMGYMALTRKRPLADCCCVLCPRRQAPRPHPYPRGRCALSLRLRETKKKRSGNRVGGVEISDASKYNTSERKTYHILLCVRAWSKQVLTAL